MNQYLIFNPHFAIIRFVCSDSVSKDKDGIVSDKLEGMCVKVSTNSVSVLHVTQVVVRAQASSQEVIVQYVFAHVACGMEM